MAREYKIVKTAQVEDGKEVRSEEVRRLVSLSCTLCSRKAVDIYDDRKRWSPTPYAISQVQVQMQEGASYPSGGDKTVKGFDICPICFETEVIPWLISKGAKLETDDFDW